jgi:hypothetical protein
MTSYSILGAQDKVAVVATWPGQYADAYSTKVTTFHSRKQAAELAEELTWVSELLWDAAAWLDTYDAAEAEVARIVGALRDTGPIPIRDGDLFAGCRHADTINAHTLTGRLDSILPRLLNPLTRAQRLSVADELAADADARTASLALLPTGFDPDEPESRIWQAAAITRATHAGVANHLPDGAPMWSARLFNIDRGPAERWGARNILHRLEQLEFAALAIGARGGLEIDPLGAHLVFPLDLFGVEVSGRGRETRPQIHISDPIPDVAGGLLAETYRAHARDANAADGSGPWMIRNAIVRVRPQIDLAAHPLDRDVFATIEIRVALDSDAGTEGRVLATLDPCDNEGFRSALGEWVGRAEFRVGW